MSRPHPGLGIALTVLMAACFAAMDSCVKRLGGFVPALLVLWARYAVQAGAMGLWLARSGSAGFRPAHPKFQAVRGSLLLATSALAFFGLKHLPLAEFTAINMLTPVLVTVLAASVLREPVSRLRWTLVAGGFVGGLIVVRPGSGLFGWAALFPLAGAFSYACFHTLSAKLSALESPYTTHFWTGAVGAALLTPLLLATDLELGTTLQALDAGAVALLLLVGALGTAGHLMLILALGVAPTSTLMPFVYTQIAFAAVLGWAMFQHAPDRWSWIGMGVIAACGAGCAWLNVREATPRRPATPVDADAVSE